MGEIFPAMAQAGYLSEELSEKLCMNIRKLTGRLTPFINKNLGDFKEFMREVSKF